MAISSATSSHSLRFAGAERDDGVDDELPHPEGGNRHERPGYAEKRDADGEGAVRLPYEREETWHVAERGGALAPGGGSIGIARSGALRL